MKLKYSLLFLSLFLFLRVSAQVKGLDTTEHKRYPIDIKYVTYLHNDYYANIDTTLNNLFLHRTIENCFTCFDLGNIGQPSFDGQFRATSSPELQEGLSAFDKNIFMLSDLAFFKVRRPYTELYYTLGSKNEQVFHANLALRLTDRLFAGFNMQYASANAFYNRQKAPLSNFSGYIQYTSKKQHFTTRAGFVVNKVRAPINGGVANDTFINDPNISQRNLEPVRLDTAVNRLKHSGFVWQSSYDLGHLTVDTSKKTPRYTLDKQMRIENTFTFEKHKYLFSDDSSDMSYYYVPFPHYTIQDSITEYHFTDEVGMKFYNKWSKQRSYLGAGMNYLRVFQPLSNNNYTQYYLKANDDRTIFSKIKDSNSIYESYYHIDGQYWYSQFVNTSYSFSENLNFLLDKYPKNVNPEISRRLSTKPKPYHHYNIYIGVLLRQSSTPPSLLQNNYQTTLYQWQNSFQNVITTSSELYIRYKSLKLHLINTTVTNYIYYGLDAMPHQYSGSINISQVQLSTRFKIWRNIYSSDEVLYQKINNTDVVSLPAVIVRTQLYFERDAFKKASHVQLGFMVRYWSDYYAPSYMPATMQFYLQQEKVIRYLPVGDVFASMQIKTAQLFLRFANVGSYLTRQVNYGALHYPMQDATIHFGIKWIMWN